MREGAGARFADDRLSSSLAANVRFRPIADTAAACLFVSMSKFQRFSLGLALLMFSSSINAGDNTLTADSAKRAVGVSTSDATATLATWNGQPTVFVDYVVDKAKVNNRGKGA